MKSVAQLSALSAGAVAAGALVALTLAAIPAQAQFVSIPVSNGSFAVSGAAGGNVYSSPLTLLSPAGTVNITATPAQPIYQAAFNITTNTAIGVYITGLSGDASLNDGRTATFTNSAAAKLETLATITGAPNWFAGAALPVGATVSFAVQSGSLDIPQAALSAYPTARVEVPITGGTFTVEAPAGAGVETLTINSILTPSGTTNLTFTFPLLVDPGNSAFPYTIQAAARPVKIGGLVNGTLTLSDGSTATVRDRPVILEGTAQVTTPAPNSVYQFPAVYGTPITVTGTFTGGAIVLLESDFPPPPTPTPPIQPPVVNPPIITPPAVTLSEPRFELASNTTLDIEPVDFVKGEHEGKLRNPDDLPEVERSSLEFSRIHPGLHTSFR